MSARESRGKDVGEAEINTNVPDKEERKRLRKKRIDRNLNKNQSNEHDNDKNQNDKNKRLGSRQITESLEHLDLRKNVGLNEITTLRVKNDEKEAKRRIDEEDMRRDRLGRLQQEALTSAKANAAIDMKWAELLEKEIPQELHFEIQSQMTSCANIIRSKDEIIVEFQRQLRAKDEEYVRNLRQEADDVEVLVQRIRREFVELKEEYDKELTAIELAYEDQRAHMIADHGSDIESMFELRRNKEIFYKEARMRREEQYKEDIELLITQGSAQYSKLKIELEMNIQTLKQQLEEIRATYQLNTEKLDYNYRVLTELDVEKNAELARYKKKLNKLKDQLNKFTSAYTELDTADQKMNNELTSDYRNLTRKYKDLQSKFRHFEVADTGRYDEMWAMHEDEAKDQVDQLLKADKLISEHMLGWSWRAPDMGALQTVLGRAGKPGVAEDSENDAAAVNVGALDTLDSVDSAMKRIAAARIKAMLKLLASEAGFLLNPEVQESINQLNEREATFAQAENMLKALGIKSEDKLNSLVKYFFHEPGDGYVSQITEENVAEIDAELALHHAGEENLEDLRNLIRAEDVIVAVKSYIEDVSADSGPVGGATVGGAKAAEEEDRIKQKRLVAMQNYWRQLSQVVSDETVDVWRQLERNAQSVQDMLVRRADAIAEVDSLSKKNAELKRLLNQYLGDSRINGALQIPPAQVMRVKQAAGKRNEVVPHGALGSPNSSKIPASALGDKKGDKVLLSQTK